MGKIKLRKQVKALIAATTVSGVIAGTTIGAIYGYSKTDKAKGEKIHYANGYREVDFAQFDMDFIDESTGSEVSIGKFIPGTKDGVEGTVNGVNVTTFINKYRKDHMNMTPLFRIRKGFFKLDNRYIDAVSADDWAKYAEWFIGYKDANGNEVPGHLAFGPEAGAINTFEIVPGVDDTSGAIILGGRDSQNKEINKITFYPDAFFGTFSLYDMGGSDYGNRLLEPLFPTKNVDADNGGYASKEFTLDQAKEAIDLINKVNEFNGKYHDSEHISPTIVQYWKEHGGSSEFTFNGSNSPAPYSIEKSSIKDGVQYYRIYGEIFRKQTQNNVYELPLVRKLAEMFPTLTVAQNESYVELNKSTGKYEVKEGLHREIPLGKRIGLAYILKAMGGDNFKGFGVDFLKYVGIHEYGHHLTLTGASDSSEGGILVQGYDGRTTRTGSEVYSDSVMNDYLSARSRGLKIVKTDAYGNPYADQKSVEAKNSPFWLFSINGRLERWDEVSTEDIQSTNDASKMPSRAYRTSLQNMQTKYIDQYADIARKNMIGEDGKVFAGDAGTTTTYNAFLQNSFDITSGTLNPSTFQGPFAQALDLQLSDNGVQKQKQIAAVFKGIGNPLSRNWDSILARVLQITAKPEEIWTYFDLQTYKYWLNFVFGQQIEHSWEQQIKQDGDADFKTWSAGHPNATQKENDAFWKSVTIKWYLEKTRTFFTNDLFGQQFFPGNPTGWEEFKTKSLASTYAINPEGLWQKDDQYTQLLPKYNQNGTSEYSSQFAHYVPNSKVVAPGSTEHGFWNAQTHSWGSYSAAVDNWKVYVRDQNDEPHPQKVFAETPGTDFTFKTSIDYKDWNAFDSANPETGSLIDLAYGWGTSAPWDRICDKDGNLLKDSSEVEEYAATNKVTIEEATKAVLTEKLKQLIRTLSTIEWNNNGASKLDSYGQFPFKSDLGAYFSDYTYQYPEVMTRDYVQTVFTETPGEVLDNMDPYLAIGQAETSFEYYVGGAITKEYATHDENGNQLPENFFTGEDADNWVAAIGLTLNADSNSLAAYDFTSFQKELINEMLSSPGKSGIMSPAYLIAPMNTIFGHDQAISNGYEKDHNLREVLGWGLYNNTGNARIIQKNSFNVWDSSTNKLVTRTFAEVAAELGLTGEEATRLSTQTDLFTIKGPHGEDATTWAQAYWFWLLKDHGIGDRTVSAIFRDTSLDRTYMYGYVPKEYATAVSELQFTNTETGEKTYIPVTVGGNTSNLFYLTHQGDESTRHTLADEGYVSWTTQKEIMGLYINSKLLPGKYNVDFVNKDRQVVYKDAGHNQHLFSMGSRDYISENGKYHEVAAIQFLKEENKEIFEIKPQFNV